MKTEMNKVPIGMANSEWLVRTVLAALREGQIANAVNQFGEQFAFNDYGIGLEFRDKGHLTDFFRKTRELYPDASLHTNRILVSGDDVVTKWTLRTRVTEPFYGGLSRKVPSSLHGASIVRMANGKITEWADYYDGLTARRTALASYFTEWIEL
jgi:hypothetical protein